MSQKCCLCVALLLSASVACGDSIDFGDEVDASVASPIDADTSDASEAVDAPAAVDASTTVDAGDIDANEMIDAEPLLGLAAARAAVDGPVDIDVSNVIVTYAKSAIGNDVAGFFVQDGPTGPALFIAVDPTTLTPIPAIGDEVSLRITAMASSGQLRQAEAIEDVIIHSAGNDVAALIQELDTADDLVSAVDSYESELVSAATLVTGAFVSAGTGHVAGPIDTGGVIGDARLVLRIPSALQELVGFVDSCEVGLIGTPLWRFADRTQLSLWQASEFVANCPSPTIVGVTALSETTVQVTFDRGINEIAVVGDARQFTFDGGLTAVTVMAVSGRSITLQTSAQVPGQNYQLIVEETVTDVLGGTVTAPNNTFAFDGFGAPEIACDNGVDDDADGFVDCLDTSCSANAACTWEPRLYLWELDADQAGTDSMEFVELWNNTGAAIALDTARYYVLLLNGGTDAVYDAFRVTYDEAGPGELPAGATFVAGATGVPSLDRAPFSDGSETNRIQNGADGVLLVQCDSCTDAAMAFPADFDVGTEATFVSADGNTVTKIDGLAYDTNDSDDTALMSLVGVESQYNENENGNSQTESLHRTSLAGWATAAPNPGSTGRQEE